MPTKIATKVTKKTVTKKTTLKKEASKKVGSTKEKVPTKKSVVSKGVSMKSPMVKLNPGGKTLVIVESPGKVKTISKYLGTQYIIKPSVGHIVDLADKNMTKLVEK